MIWFLSPSLSSSFYPLFCQSLSLSIQIYLNPWLTVNRCLMFFECLFNLRLSNRPSHRVMERCKNLRMKGERLKRIEKEVYGLNQMIRQTLKSSRCEEWWWDKERWEENEVKRSERDTHNKNHTSMKIKDEKEREEEMFRKEKRREEWKVVKKGLRELYGSRNIRLMMMHYM